MTTAAVWKGPEPLRVLLVPLGDLKPDPANARFHPERNLSAIARSLDLFGQQKPVVVRDGVVIAGNGTLRAATALGWSHLAAVTTDLDAKGARGFAVADNRSAELAQWDPEALTATLRDLESLGLRAVEDLGFEPNDGVLDDAGGKGTGALADAGADRAVKYRVIVECADETDQRELIARLEREGRSVRALLSA